MKHIFVELFSPSISFQEFFLLKISLQDIHPKHNLYHPVYPRPTQKSNGWPLNRSQTMRNVSVWCANYNLNIIVGPGWGTPLPCFLRSIVMSLKGQGCRSSRMGLLLDPLQITKKTFVYTRQYPSYSKTKWNKQLYNAFITDCNKNQPLMTK